MQTEHLRNFDKNSCLQRYSILALEWTIYQIELETSFFQQFLGRFYAMDGRKPENFSSAQNKMFMLAVIAERVSVDNIPS